MLGRSCYRRRLLQGLHQTELTGLKEMWVFPQFQDEECEDYQVNSGNLNGAFSLKSEYNVQICDPTGLVFRTAAINDHRLGGLK